MTLTPVTLCMVQWQPFLPVAFELYGCKWLLVVFSCGEGSCCHTVLPLIYTAVTQGIKSLGHDPFLIM